MSRISLAITTLVLLAAGVVSWGWIEGGEPIGKVLVRVAMVFGAFWLAMPQLQGVMKNIGGQYALLISIAAMVTVLSPKGGRAIIPVVVLATLALGGLHLAQRFFGSTSPQQRPKH
jgi:hypothetical protein